MDDSNRFEDLREEETRSVNSDEMGASTDEFIASEDDMDREPEEQELGILTQGREHVPIFNTPNAGNLDGEEQGQAEMKNGPEGLPEGGPGRGEPQLFKDRIHDSEDSEAEEERVRIRQVGRVSLGGPERGGNLRETMMRKELTDSTPTEHDELSLAPSLEGGGQLREGPLRLGGEITRVQGLTDRPNLEEGGVTRPFNRDIYTRMPPGTDDSAPPKGASCPKPPKEQENHPLQSAGQQGGGVDINWGAFEEDESVMLFNEPGQLELSEELMGRAKAITHDIRGCLDEAAEVCITRHQVMAESGNEWIAEKRVDLLEQYGVRGYAIPLLNLTAEETRELSFVEGDLFAQLGGTTERFWGRFKLSKAEFFKEEDVKEIFQEYQVKLDKLENDLTRAMGGRAVEKLKRRHRMIQGSLNKEKGVPRKAYKLFPQDMAGAIMEWYARGLAMLNEVERIKENYRDGISTMAMHFTKYPGPREEDIPELQEDMGTKRKTGVELGDTWTSERGTKEARPEPTNVQSLVRQRESSLEVAGSAGYGYRMASTGPSQSGPSQSGILDRRALRYPKGFDPTRSRGEGNQDRRGQLGAQDSRVEDEEESQVMTSDEMTILSAFGGLTRAEVVDQLLAYAYDALARQGKDTTEVRRIIAQNMPSFTVVTKFGSRSTIMNSFSKHVKDIKPHCDGQYISMDEWWQSLAEMAQDLGISIPFMCRFMAKTGALASGIHDVYRQRVKDMWKDRARWLPNYDPNRDEKELEYWAYIWMDVTVKFMREFYVVMDNDEIVEAALKELFELPTYELTDTEDPINMDMWKAYQLYVDTLFLLKDRGSDLVESPLYPFNLVKKWLLTQGIAGHGIHALLVKAVKQLGVNPESVFPPHHQLSAKRLAEIMAGGASKADESVLLLIWEQLKCQANNKEFTYAASNLTQMRLMQAAQTKGDDGDEKKKKQGSRERKVNAVAAASPATASSSMSGSAGQDTGRGGGGGYLRYLCPSCSLNHDESPKCPFWDKQKREFNHQAFLKFKTVRTIRQDGSSRASEFWKEKLRRYSFARMGLSEAEQRDLLRKLDETAMALPIVSDAERLKLTGRAKNSNLAVQDTSNTQALVEMRDQIVALTAEVQRGRERKSSTSASKAKTSKSSRSKSAKKSKKSKSKKSWAASDSESEAPELAEDTSSDESDDSEDS